MRSGVDSTVPDSARKLKFYFSVLGRRDVERQIDRPAPFVYSQAF